MTNFKTALINCTFFCKFPRGINNIKEFVNYLNENYNSFIELVIFKEDGCIPPYFIEEDLKTETVYINPSNIREVRESEIYILSREEYAEKLTKVIQQKCIHCVNYEEHSQGDNLNGHWENISLDGECYGFKQKKNN